MSSSTALLSAIAALLVTCTEESVAAEEAISNAKQFFAATISNAQKCLEKGGEFFHSIMLKYKPKVIKDKFDQDFAPLIRRRIK